MLAIASNEPLGSAPVVGDADLHPIGDTRFGDALAGELCLTLGRSVMPSTSTPCSRAAWIAKLPQPQPTSSTRIPGSSAELARDELEFRALRLVERLGAAREDRAAVGHGVVEEQREELVADVVVVADRGGVALGAVQLSAQDQLEARTPRQPAGGRGGDEREAEAHAVGYAERRRRPCVDDEEGGVEVVDRERAVDVGAPEAERARRGQEVGERGGPSDEERGGFADRRLHRAAIPETHVEGSRREHPFQLVAERTAYGNHCHAPTITYAR